MRHDAAPRTEVLSEFRKWATALAASRHEVLRAGCFGSYARGDYGPASDLDIFVEVSQSPHERWFDRAADFSSTRDIPVGVELFIYTSEEIERMEREGSPWLRRILSEMVWV